MTAWLGIFDRLTTALQWLGVFLAAATAGAVVIERAAAGLAGARERRVERRYRALMQRALAGDAAAAEALADSPSRHRFMIATMLLYPLLVDRNPQRIDSTRAVVTAIRLLPFIDRYINSWRWWRRVMGLRAVGIIQLRSHTAAIVAALDDPHPQVRAAALDALADLRDPAALPALIVRLLDTSLQRSRREAAVAAFGRKAEPFLLDLAHVDAVHRAAYARALMICGTKRARPTLCEWLADVRADVRAASFAALRHVGLDKQSAQLAIAGLDSREVAVRAMAATALYGWKGAGDAAAALARHLDDAWPVAVEAAQSLQSMQEAGREALAASASRPDLAGVLARQMLWEARAQW
jgi:HEAT repeat protein